MLTKSWSSPPHLIYSSAVNESSVISVQIHDASKLSKKKDLAFLGIVTVNVAECDLTDHGQSPPSRTDLTPVFALSFLDLSHCPLLSELYPALFSSSLDACSPDHLLHIYSLSLFLSFPEQLARHRIECLRQFRVRIPTSPPASPHGCDVRLPAQEPAPAPVVRAFVATTGLPPRHVYVCVAVRDGPDSCFDYSSTTTASAMGIGGAYAWHLHPHLHLGTFTFLLPTLTHSLTLLQKFLLLT